MSTSKTIALSTLDIEDAINAIKYLFERQLHSISEFFAAHPHRRSEFLTLMHTAVGCANLLTPVETLRASRGKQSSDGTGRRFHAKNMVNLAISKIDSRETLVDLKHCLCSTRTRSSNFAGLPLTGPYQYKNPRGAELMEHLKELHGHLNRHCSSDRLSKAQERFHLARVAELYVNCQEKRKDLLPEFRGSLAVLFANLIIGDRVRKLKTEKHDSPKRIIQKSESPAKGGRRPRDPMNRKIQKQWDRFMANAKPWYLIVRTYGPGLLPLIPDMENEDLRLHNEIDLSAVIERIASIYPTLADDVKNLALIFTPLVQHKCLPQQKFLLETLTDEEISSSGLPLRDLLTFLGETSGTETALGPNSPVSRQAFDIGGLSIPPDMNDKMLEVQDSPTGRLSNLGTCIVNSTREEQLSLPGTSPADDLDQELRRGPELEFDPLDFVNVDASLSQLGW